MDAEADRLARAPFTGDIPPGLENMRYHMLYLQPESARMVIRKYEVGRYCPVGHCHPIHQVQYMYQTPAH